MWKGGRRAVPDTPIFQRGNVTDTGNRWLHRDETLSLTPTHSERCKRPAWRGLGMLAYSQPLLKCIGTSCPGSLAIGAPRNPSQVWLCQQEFLGWGWGTGVGGSGWSLQTSHSQPLYPGPLAIRARVIVPILTDRPTEAQRKTQVLPLLEELVGTRDRGCTWILAGILPTRLFPQGD